MAQQAGFRLIARNTANRRRSQESPGRPLPPLVRQNNSTSTPNFVNPIDLVNNGQCASSATSNHFPPLERDPLDPQPRQQDPVSLSSVEMPSDLDFFSGIDAISSLPDFSVQSSKTGSEYSSLSSHAQPSAQFLQNTTSVARPSSVTRYWDHTLQPILLSNLDEHAVKLITAANGAQCPPSVIVQDGTVKLDFTSFAAFLEEISQCPTQERSSTVATPSNINRYVTAYQNYQEVRPRRSSSKQESPPLLSGIYICTLGHDCTKSFKRKDDWKRHEKAHYPQEIWHCSQQPCASKLEPFRRREHFIKHWEKVHDSMIRMTVKETERFRIEVLNSQWPRECPFANCDQNDFPSFDDRLEHIDKQHIKKSDKLSQNASYHQGGDDGDGGGSSEGHFDGSSRSLYFCGDQHDPHNVNGSGSGTGTSGSSSSTNFPGSSGTYWASDCPRSHNLESTCIIRDQAPGAQQASRTLSRTPPLVSSTRHDTFGSPIQGNTDCKALSEGRAFQSSRGKDIIIQPSNATMYVNGSFGAKFLDGHCRGRLSDLQQRMKKYWSNKGSLQFSFKRFASVRQPDKYWPNIHSLRSIRHPCSYPVDRFLQEAVKEQAWTEFRYYVKPAPEYLEEIYRNIQSSEVPLLRRLGD